MNLRQHRESKLNYSCMLIGQVEVNFLHSFFSGPLCVLTVFLQPISVGGEQANVEVVMMEMMKIVKSNWIPEVTLNG